MRFRATIEFWTFEGKEEDEYFIADQIKTWIKMHLEDENTNIDHLEKEIGKVDFNVSVIPLKVKEE